MARMIMIDTDTKAVVGDTATLGLPDTSPTDAVEALTRIFHPGVLATFTERSGRSSLSVGAGYLVYAVPDDKQAYATSDAVEAVGDLLAHVEIDNIEVGGTAVQARVEKDGPATGNVITLHVVGSETDPKALPPIGERRANLSEALRPEALEQALKTLSEDPRVDAPTLSAALTQVRRVVYGLGGGEVIQSIPRKANPLLKSKVGEDLHERLDRVHQGIDSALISLSDRMSKDQRRSAAQLSITDRPARLLLSAAKDVPASETAALEVARLATAGGTEYRRQNQINNNPRQNRTLAILNSWGQAAAEAHPPMQGPKTEKASMSTPVKVAAGLATAAVPAAWYAAGRIEPSLRDWHARIGDQLLDGTVRLSNALLEAAQSLPVQLPPVDALPPQFSGQRTGPLAEPAPPHAPPAGPQEAAAEIAREQAAGKSASIRRLPAPSRVAAVSALALAAGDGDRAKEILDRVFSPAVTAAEGPRERITASVHAAATAEVDRVREALASPSRSASEPDRSDKGDASKVSRERQLAEQAEAAAPEVFAGLATGSDREIRSDRRLQLAVDMLGDAVSQRALRVSGLTAGETKTSAIAVRRLGLDGTDIADGKALAGRSPSGSELARAGLLGAAAYAAFGRDSAQGISEYASAFRAVDRTGKLAGLEAGKAQVAAAPTSTGTPTPKSIAPSLTKVTASAGAQKAAAGVGVGD